MAVGRINEGFFKITKCMVVLRAAKKSGRSKEVTVLSMWP